MEKILLLQQLPGFGLLTIKKFLIENSFLIDDDEFIKKYIESYTGKTLNHYKDKVKRILDNCDYLQIKILKVEKSKIVNAPLLLFIKGDEILLLQNKLLGVVGTRSPSERGIRIGSEIIEYLIQSGWVTVSGLARGCDTLCHRMSVNGGGRTIAVIPSGYNSDIAPWVLDSGVILSEYPPGTQIKKYRCIERNRIITGLSKGLYVIESTKGGGSEHSIKYAHKGQIPISYSIGFNGINNYGAVKVENKYEFDQYLKKCIN